MDLTPAAVERWRQNIADSTRANYLYEMGRALIAQDDKDEGLRRIRASLDLYPVLHEARSFLIDHLRAEGANAEAQTLDAQARASFPDFTGAYALSQVKRRLEQGDCDGARSLLITVIAEHGAPDGAIDCWRQIMGHQLQTGAPPADLLASAEAILTLDGTATKASEIAGINALLLGRYEDAVRHLDRLCAATENHHNGFLFSGMACYCAGRFADALARFDATLRCTPATENERLQSHAGAHAYRAGTFLAMGDMDAARTAIAQARAISADDFRSKAFSALVLDRQGQFDEAIEAAQGALRISADHPFALIVLGHALTGRGRHEEALATMARLQGRPSHLASTMLDLGVWMSPVILPLAVRAGIPLRQMAEA